MANSPNVYINIQNLHGRQPLHQAAQNGHAGVVRLLISKGADVLAEDKEGRTALRLAVENGHMTVVRQLLDLKKLLHPANQLEMVHLWATVRSLAGKKRD
jgi:ankyrin repeat protein